MFNLNFVFVETELESKQEAADDEVQKAMTSLMEEDPFADLLDEKKDSVFDYKPNTARPKSSFPGMTGIKHNRSLSIVLEQEEEDKSVKGLKIKLKIFGSSYIT